MHNLSIMIDASICVILYCTGLLGLGLLCHFGQKIIKLKNMFFILLSKKNKRY